MRTLSILFISNALIITSIFGMEQSPSSLLPLPEDTHLYVIALAKNNPSLHLVNKQYSRLITQENMLRTCTASLSWQDHMRFMVKAAKQYNGDDSLIKLGFDTASLYGHDCLKTLPYFMPNSSPIMQTEKNSGKKFISPEESFATLLPYIVSVYRGDPGAINAYKCKPRKLLTQMFNPRITALHVVANRKRNEFWIAELLLAQDPTLLNKLPLEPSDMDPSDNYAYILTMATPLEVAIARANTPLCALLLSFKNIDFDPSSSLNPEYTFLEWALHINNNFTIAQLVADQIIKQHGKERLCSLIRAQTLNLAMIDYPMSKFLLEKIEYKLPGATQPLHCAVFKILDNIKIIKKICKHPNTNINAQDEKGKTPLLICFQQGMLSCAKLLLQAGADPHIKDRNGTCAYDFLKYHDIKKFQ